VDHIAHAHEYMGCSAAGLQAGDGRVERFAQIAVRHPDDHRAELQAALGI
jgi:hypothetical protein